MDNSLFSPFKLKGLTLKNRLVMAPMTREFSPDGIPTEDVAAYYARRAEGGVGLIITEGTVIERPASKNERDIPDFFGEALPAWGKVVEAVHAKGGLIAPQIWHTGASPSRGDDYDPQPKQTPSGVNGKGKAKWPAMTEADIADTISAFAKAAKDAQALGFDAVEFHGAHGYLIDEFFWDVTNTRNDQWGGKTIAERTRFAVEVLKAARKEVGPDFPLILRLSQFKGGFYEARNANSPQDMSEWLTPLVEAGADVLHCSQRRFWEPEFDGSELNFAGWAKKLTGAPVITVGSVGLSGDFIAGFGGEVAPPEGIEALVKRFEQGEFDLVAVGRALISNPDWVARVRDKSEGFKAFDRALLKDLI
jgi:2,4-dienoyl-CoA reductase-like NADH-dependent reductase (Old Yellow Enzyme family)